MKKNNTEKLQQPRSNKLPQTLGVREKGESEFCK